MCVLTMPLCVCASSCAGGIDKYTNLASQLIPEIGEAKALVFVDFIRDVAPLAISLRQEGLPSCGYHRDKMTSHDKARRSRTDAVGKFK